MVFTIFSFMQASQQSTHSPFSIRHSLSSPFILLFLIVFISGTSKSEELETDVLEDQWPVFAAQLSDDILAHCQSNKCHMNVIDANTLVSLMSEHDLALDLKEALALSEYEVLISSAVLFSSYPSLSKDTLEQEASSILRLEITTSWRGIPIDDFNIEQSISGQDYSAEQTNALTNTAFIMLSQWIDRAKEEDILAAEKIYAQLGASNYFEQLKLPERIGDFVKFEQGLYHDPMQGSITRYVHPDYEDAIVDISVYPVSPFVHREKSLEDSVTNEMLIEKSQIQALIEHANIKDFMISDIQTTKLNLGNRQLPALAMEVALETSIDPVYSTQFLFTQHDKFVKLTGNLPKSMMLALVQDSLSDIEVPDESEFMRAMRQK